MLDLLGQGGIAAVLGGIAGGGAPMPTAGAAGIDPTTIATLALTFLQGSTDVETTNDATVAGRAAYELVLRPRDPQSLIDSVVLAIDAQEKIPLRFAVNARGGGAPAIEIAFTEVSFGRPDASQFAFNPPPGATVKEEEDGPRADHPEVAPPATPDGVAPGAPDHAIVGSGWTSVLVVAMPDDLGDAEQLLGLLPTVSGDWGSGRLLSTRLVSALLTDDGRLLLGAVSAERLYAAAADPAAKLGG